LHLHIQGGFYQHKIVWLHQAQKKVYIIPIKGGTPKEIADSSDYVKSDRISPNGKYRLTAEDVKLRKVFWKRFLSRPRQDTKKI
jgi:hypothetical protein